MTVKPDKRPTSRRELLNYLWGAGLYGVDLYRQGDGTMIMRDGVRRYLQGVSLRSGTMEDWGHEFRGLKKKITE